jgi:hypothetical protein
MDGSATTFNNYCVRRRIKRITERRIDDWVVYWWEYMDFRVAYGPKLTLAEIGNCRLVWDPRQIAATTSKTIRLASVFSGTESDHAVHSVTSLPLFRTLRTEEMKSRSTLTLAD